MAKDRKKSTDSAAPRLLNKKARFNYEILETVEAGIALKGTEVKSLRAGDASVNEAYARITDGQVFLINFQIQPYKQAGEVFNHDPKRPKQLLLHKREIKKLSAKVQIRGQTMVPLCVYFVKGKAKVEIALARGKKRGDKRQDERAKQDRKDIARAQRRGGM